MRKWLITTIVTIILFIVGLAGAGWSQRPIIDYKMDGILDTLNLEYETLRISLTYRNRGNVDASLLLVIRVKNANITIDKKEPWITYNETQVKFHVAAPSHMETYSSQVVTVTPVGNPQNFTIVYTIENVSGWSISGIISQLFLELHPYYPTQATYNKTDSTNYELLK